MKTKNLLLIVVCTTLILSSLKSQHLYCLTDGSFCTYQMNATFGGGSNINLNGVYMGFIPFWNANGVYNRTTHTLNMQIFNPAPSGCAPFVDSYVFNMTQCGKFLFCGTFTQFCGGFPVGSGTYFVSGAPGSCRISNPNLTNYNGPALPGFVFNDKDFDLNSFSNNTGDLLKTLDEWFPETASLSLSPNPSIEKSIANILLPTNGDAMLLITNTLGQVVFSRKIIADQSNKAIVEIPSLNFSDGVYLVSLNCNGTVVTEKLVVTHD